MKKYLIPGMFTEVDTTHACTVIAQLLNKDPRTVAGDFMEAHAERQLTISRYLAKERLVFKRCYGDSQRLAPNCIHLCLIPIFRVAYVLVHVLRDRNTCLVYTPDTGEVYEDKMHNGIPESFSEQGLVPMLSVSVQEILKRYNIHNTSGLVL